MHNTLFLQRLRIVTYEGKVAYDEPYHRGVNIIRGQNSSGKSTIVRFIFFVLGGYYTDFVPQAMKCQYVMAEVCINGTVITIKRFLERRNDGKVNGYAPMYIHFGPMTDVLEPLNLEPSLWSRYGYTTTDKTTSFSNVLFDILGYPPVKADSNITMHQVLRLIYLDQESPVNSLFFYEQFDKEIYRETVANLLLGLYDTQYSDARQELQNTIKAIAEKKVSIKNVGEFLQAPRTKSSAFIRAEIDRLNAEIEDLGRKVQELRMAEPEKKDQYLLIAHTDNVNPNASDVVNYYFDDKKDLVEKIATLPVVAKSEVVQPKLKLEYQRILDDITKQRKACDNLEREIFELENEIEDSEFFIAALTKRKEAIDHSIATRDYFDSLHLDFCPKCLTPIDKDVEEGHCPLCKSPIDNTKGKSQAMHIRLELDFQIRESRSLKEENQHELDEKKAQLRRMKRQLTATQRHYDDAVSYVRSTHEERIDKLLQDKGFKEGEILQYRTLLEQAEKYEKLIAELSRLKAREEELERFIAATENRINAERKTIDAAVSESGVYLLRNDQDCQEDFIKAQEFVIDYSQNMAYISNQRIKLSASSAFYLKMVARFALLFASLKVDSMMYPRLLFSDNMEDKGLTEDRAMKFQRTVVGLLKEHEKRNGVTNPVTLEYEQEPLPDYQLIFATSMIAPELDTKEFTVGEKYTGDNKSLKNV